MDLGDQRIALGVARYFGEDEDDVDVGVVVAKIVNRTQGQFALGVRRIVSVRVCSVVVTPYASRK